MEKYMKRFCSFIFCILLVSFFTSCVKEVIYSGGKSYKITFDANGGEGHMAAQLCNDGVEYNIATSLMKKQGYYFSNWATKADGSGSTYDDCGIIKLTSDITLYAQYSVSSGTEYHVNHYLEAINPDDPEILLGRETLTGTTGTDTHAFARILVGFTSQPFSQEKIAADGSTEIDIYYTRKEYKVTFYINKGLAEDSYTQTFRYEEEKELLPNSFSINYNAFKGWNTKADGSGTYYANKEVVTNEGKNLYLYAQWEIDTAAKDVLNLSVTRNGNDVIFKWGIPDDVLKSITVSYKANSDVNYTDVILSGATSSYTIKGKVPLISYEYKISTVDSVDNVSKGITGTLNALKNFEIEGTEIPYSVMTSVMTDTQYKVTVAVPDVKMTSGYTNGTYSSEFKNASKSSPIIVDNFIIGKYEVTEQFYNSVCRWAYIMGYTYLGNPSVSTSTKPIKGKTDAAMFLWCNALSEYMGYEPCYYSDAGCTQLLSKTAASTKFYVKAGADGYRVPTDIEFEFAARGGNETVADWLFNYSGSTTASLVNVQQSYDKPASKTVSETNVGTLLPNRLGIYDMTGNVAELVQSGSYRGVYYTYRNSNMSPDSNSYSYYGLINNEKGTGSCTKGFRICRSNK